MICNENRMLPKPRKWFEIEKLKLHWIHASYEKLRSSNWTSVEIQRKWKPDLEMHVAKSLLGIAEAKNSITLWRNLTPLKLLHAVYNPIRASPLLLRQYSATRAWPRTRRYPPSHFHSQLSDSDFIQTHISYMYMYIWNYTSICVCDGFY